LLPRVLGVDTSSLRIAGEGSNPEQKIKEAAERLKVQLEPSSPMTSEKLATLMAANEKLTQLIAINEKRFTDAATQISATTDEFARRKADNEFSLHLPGPATEQSRERYIRDRLKRSPDEANGLIGSLSKRGVDLSKIVSGPMEGVLRTDSNNKRLQQQRKLYEHGLADPVVGVDFAIEAVLQAREKGIELKTINNESLEAKGQRVYEAAIAADLSEGSATILKMLTYGVIRVEEEGSRPVALDVHNDGRLYARESYFNVDAHDWALGGAAPAAE
jgi:hypothetical protein